MHCLDSILGEERIEEIVEIFFFESNLSQNIMVSIYVTLLQFFLREQMTHLGPHLGDGLAPLDLSVQEGDR